MGRFIWIISMFSLIDNGCISIVLLWLLLTGLFWIFFSLQGLYKDNSRNLVMFKAVLKKNRDGSKGSKKDSGMWKIRRKNCKLGSRKQINTPYLKV